MRAAAAALAQLIEGRALPEALARVTDEHRLTGISRSAARDIAYGATRRLGTARALAARLNSRDPAPAAWPAATPSTFPPKSLESLDC